MSRALDEGWRTADLADPADPDDGLVVVGTTGMATAVIEALEAAVPGMTAADRPVVLYDTTLRDGTQGENITLSLADKLRIARMLDEYGMPYIEGGWPGSNPKDIEFFAAARTMRWETAKLAAFGSTRHRSNAPGDDPNLRELVAAETPVVTIFGKSWLLHVTEVLGATPQQNLDMIADSIAFVADRGREAVYDAEHFFDGYRADREYALATLRAARQAGARTLVLCDTNGGTLTDELTGSSPTCAASIEADPDAPAVTWGIHTHNDAELAVANSMAAVAAGIRHVQGTINGYGERAGNANMVSILANLALKTEHELVPAGGGRLDGLTELSRSVAEIANVDAERLPAVRRPLGVRAQGRRPRRGRRQGRALVPARRAGRRSATPAGSSSRSSAAGPTRRSGHASSVTSSRASSTRASCRSSSSSSNRRASRSRAPRRRSSCSSGATPRTTPRRSGSSTTPASSSSAAGASCSPRPPSRSRSPARRCTPPPTATAR